MPEFLKVENFAQIHKAEIEFGDLTVLVGPQATGKSLLLQLFKLALDRRFVASMMGSAGLVWKTPAEFIGRYFGEGMETAWSASTKVETHQGELKLERLPRAKPEKSETVFYIPAHRALLLVDGWPLRFERFKEDTPIVARLFSDALFGLLAEQKLTDLFPASKRLKAPFREIIDEAVFHGGKVRLVEQGRRGSRRLEILYRDGEEGLPFLTWTVGQREFTPLLLSLYSVIPAGAVSRKEPLKWVIIEEPEMGLHPRAIEVVMLLVLELLKRDYKVILSTHSPVVVEVVWGLRRLRETQADPATLLKAFRVEQRHDLRPLAEHALGITGRVYSLSYGDQGVGAHDISSLNSGSPNAHEASWGGLTEFTARIEDAVASAGSP